MARRDMAPIFSAVRTDDLDDGARSRVHSSQTTIKKKMRLEIINLGLLGYELTMTNYGNRYELRLKG